MNTYMHFSEAVFKESKLAELAKENPQKCMDCKELDKPLALPFRSSFLPKSGGEWSDERGDSKWMPDLDGIPERSNPDGLTWKQILEKYNIDGIKFNAGEPDFSEISKGTVEIEDFSLDRDKNFTHADEAEAGNRGCSPEDVKDWRRKNNYTWHECRDCRTMEKVPSEVHNNIAHAGGISEMKKEIHSNDEVIV
jgi:hypothetical protein